jgi:hypothetical protein
MEFIYANFYRPGETEPYAENIYIQVAHMDAKEAAEYKGADPHFTYHMYTRLLPTGDPTLVQQRDLVVDQQVIDPLTGKPRQFRIISDPQMKQLMMSWQWIAIKPRGT